MRKLLLSCLACLLAACVGIPGQLKPVQNFDAQAYLGTWYEIARLDNRFEAGLEQVSAEYSRREDGGLRVLNRGYDPALGVWKSAEGKAYFVEDPHQGRLKVSFFGPFYGAYNIIALDRQAGYSLVCGADYDYLWILARSKHLPDEVLRNIVETAKSLGFATDKLIFVKQ